MSSEWSLMLNGSVRLVSVNEAGEVFLDDLQAGDVWFFPPGVPHSIQALSEGAQFLLVFDSGYFSEDSTFLVTETFLRNPKAVLAKNLQVDVSDIPDPEEMPYIFHGTPAPKNIEDQNTTGPAGTIPQERSYSYHWSQQKPYEVPGGNVKILDTQTFPIADDFSAALFTFKPCGCFAVSGSLAVFFNPTSGFVFVTSCFFFRSLSSASLIFSSISLNSSGSFCGP